VLRDAPGDRSVVVVKTPLRAPA